jgi:hypothetical protein
MLIIIKVNSILIVLLLLCNGLLYLGCAAGIIETSIDL